MAKAQGKHEYLPSEAINFMPEIVLPNGMKYLETVLPKQLEFHRAKQKFRAMGGGVGAGKTYAACVDALVESWIYPNNFGYILRRTLPELDSSTLLDFLEVVPPPIILHENKTKRYFDLLTYKGLRMLQENPSLTYQSLRRAKATSRVQFMSFENTLEAYQKFQSANLGWFFIDQAEEATEEVFDALVKRLRRVPSSRRGWFVWNPAGHNWCWKKFHRNSPGYDEQRFYLVNVDTQDNPYLPPDYEDSLLETLSKDKIERYLRGSYEVFTGTVFKDFDMSVHVIDPFVIPEDWDRACALDHGLNNPTAVGFYARDYDGNIFRYDEHFQSGWLVAQHARAIADRVRQCHYRLIDPACKARDATTGKSVIQEYAGHGLYFMAANNDVAAGIDRCASYLRVDPERIHPLTKQKGSPRFFVFKTCQHFLDEVLDYQWQRLKTGIGEKNEPEAPRKYKDHCMNEWRYCMMHFADPIVKILEQGFAAEPGEGLVTIPPPEFAVSHRRRRLERSHLHRGGWMSA